MNPNTSKGPLPSEALERDASESGVEGDEQTEGGTDTSLPASESDTVEAKPGGASRIERNIAELPPG